MYTNTLTVKLKHEDEMKEFNLRLTVGAQLKLKKECKEEGIQLVFAAMDDLELMLKVFSLALSFKDNKNEITDGAQFYELLVDNGYSGKEAFAKLIFDIAAVSGIIKEEQSEKLSSMISTTYNAMFDSLSGEKVLETIAAEKADEESEIFRSEQIKPTKQ